MKVNLEKEIKFHDPDQPWEHTLMFEKSKKEYQADAFKIHFRLAMNWKNKGQKTLLMIPIAPKTCKLSKFFANGVNRE